MSVSQNAAEDIGLKALIWLAGNEDLMPVFLGASGADVAAIKASAGDPAFLASVLDFLLMDDAWVMGFCEAEGLSYEQPKMARAALPGGEQVSWT
ncbi:DUF3572 domain-containing protein [Lentibacter sp.]|jgi:hypothetical protein|uniref:DUF3572 domain-containing protein n=1 Tax=Lentibacter sp. TaxID=2024994 RepID=UPI003F697547